MYHTNGFSPLTYLLGGDELVVLEKFDAAMVVDESSVVPHHELHRHPDDVSRIAAFPISVNGISPASRGSCKARR